jgi:anti-sigma regulatory factor (Ser/Thr protein kinase)
VRHAQVGSDSRLTLVLSLSERTLRVEVHDPGPGFDASRPAPAARPGSGNGLRIVARIADRWGIAREETTRVWFEIDGAQGPEPNR